MGFNIELSFDIVKNSNVISIKQLLSDLAEKHNSKTNYFIHEIEGHSTTIDRNDCVNIVEFEITDKLNIIRYIKDIIKIKFIKIDCIYQEKGKINVLYASKRYLLTVNTKSSSPLLSQSPTKIIELVQTALNNEETSNTTPY